MRVVLFFLFSSLVAAEEIVVRDAASLQSAIRNLKANSTVKIAPGDYPGGYQVSGIERVTIKALDPARPPVFKGGKTGFQFTRCAHLSLRHLKIVGQTENGLNLDDGGLLDQPVHGITLDHLEVSDIGPSGNHDGIKCSGLDGLKITDCILKGWGGQGIDFVGCHDSLITGCRFEGKPGFTASAAIQLKGGTRNVTVEKCHFVNAGERPLNIGGSTGLAYFRPQGAKHEAANIKVRENVIEGSLCAAAFVGVDGAQFTDNSIRFPTRWIFRILQETREPGFVPCRKVEIRNNHIVFRRSQVETELNIGDDTEPGTFVFEGNRWHAEDKPESSRPKLPVAESGGIYGK
jgi:hypothetical protein